MRALARSGLTLIELVVALAIIAVLAAVAVPSLREFMLQQRLKSAASELLADVQLARSTSLSLASVGSFVTVNFRSNSNLTCYAIAVVTSQLTNCDCTRSTNICQFAGVAMTPPLRVVTIDRQTGINVTSATQMYFNSSGMLAFDRSERTLAVNSSTGLTLNVMIGQTGFPHLCAPSGTNISGVPTCT